MKNSWKRKHFHIIKIIPECRYLVDLVPSFPAPLIPAEVYPAQNLDVVLIGMRTIQAIDDFHFLLKVVEALQKSVRF